MMPILLETLRISMIFNFTGVMIAEMYASRTGIGHLIANWGENFQMPQLFAGVIMLAVVAILFNETVRYPGGSMQHVANVTQRAQTTQRRDRGRSTSATSMPGATAACRRCDDISMTVERGPLRRHRRPERLRQDLAADDAGGPARIRREGTILCDGRPIPKPDPERVGVVFQEASLFPWLTALDNIEFPLALRGTPREERRRRAEAMLTLVGLDGIRRALPARAVRRHEAARLDRARPGAGPAGAADGRAVRRARRADPHDDGP